MGQIVTFPFISGLETGTDKAVLADGKLADAQNVEMDRVGRLRVRARFVAQPTTSFTGNSAFVAYDLFTLNERLFALGDSFNYGFPADIFEYITGAAATWKPSSPRNQTNPRLPRTTRVKELVHAPDQPGGVANIGCAATSGFSAMVYNSSDQVQLGCFLGVQSSQNQPVVFDSLDTSSGHPCRALRVVGLSDRFMIVGVSNNDGGLQVSFARWIMATDKTVAQVSAGVLTSATAISVLATYKVDGADNFLVAANLNGTIRIRRYDNVGTLIVPSGGQFADITAAATQIAIAADTTNNRLVAVFIVAGQAKVQSYNLSTGATVLASTNIFTGDTITTVSLFNISTGYTLVGSCTSSTPICIRKVTLTTAGSLISSGTYQNDVQIAGQAFPIIIANGPDALLPVVQGPVALSGQTNMLLRNALHETTPEIVKDFELAGVPVTPLLSDLTKDVSTGKMYWANCAASPDGDLLPQMTEFVVDSTARRQTAQLGNLTYIAGGCPLVFDGGLAVESGFLTRPRIISLTPSTGSGQLLGSVTYDYRVHAEWVDDDDNLHLSPPSAIKSVTLGSANNTVTANVSTHFSQRLNNGADYTGSQVRYVLSRTLGSVSKTAAVITGTLNASPPSSPLAAAPTLKIFTYSGAGPTVQFNVAFGAGDITASAIAATINAVTAGVVIASDVGGRVRLSSVVLGAGSFISVANQLPAQILGLTPNVNFEGTTTVTKGENFQRTAVAYSQPAGGSSTLAGPIDIVDIRKDESDPVNTDTDLIAQAVLYSQGNSIGAHNAPMPAEYIWASRERVELGGLPRRNQIQHSKTLAPGEPAEFTTAGVVSFIGQVRGDIIGIAVLGDSVVVWTRREIWFVSGAGPNRANQGEFFAATRISAAGGLVEQGWRSICESDIGIFFQLSGDKIYLITKSGAMEWIGREAQDYLDQFPVVTCAVHSISKHSVLFGLTNTGGSTGGILRYDLENKTWFFDNVGAVTAMAEYGTQIAYVQGGVVFLQDALPGSGTFVSYLVQSNMFQGFQQLGWGAINKIGFLGTFKGDCTVEAFISYDGVTFITMGSFALTTAEYTVGQRIVRLWDPKIQKIDQFAVKYVVTGTSGSEGVWLHSHALDVDRAPELSRQGAAHNR